MDRLAEAIRDAMAQAAIAGLCRESQLEIGAGRPAGNAPTSPTKNGWRWRRRCMRVREAVGS